MLIDSIEALREWLTLYLAPLCDADPPALAKYCIALIRKDKPESELKDDMLQQLEVFLQENTTSFVEKFVTVVKAKSYLPKPAATKASTTTTTTAAAVSSNNKIPSKAPPLPPPPSPLIPPPPPPLSPSVTASSNVTNGNKTSTESKVPSTTKENGSKVSTTSSKVPSVGSKTASKALPSSAVSSSNGLLPPPLPAVAPPPPSLSSLIPPPLPGAAASVAAAAASTTVAPKKDDTRTKKDERESRSWRSRSRERRRSRSRGRTGRNNKYDDRNRRRSPRSSRYSRTSPAPRGSRAARSPNTRRSRSPVSLRTHSPVPRSHSPKHRSRSPLVSQRSPFVSRRSPLAKRSASPSRKSLSPQRSLSRSPHARGRSPLLPTPLLGKEGQQPASPCSPDAGTASSPLTADMAEDKEGSSPELDSQTHGKVSSSARRKKNRCKDYDEKGYCMRGGQCPFDHGKDPVVLDFTPSTYTGSGTAPAVGANNGSHGGVPGGAPNLAVPPPRHLASRLTVPHPPITDSQNEYTPSDPSLWGSSNGPNTALPPPSQYFRGDHLMGRTGPPPPVVHSSLPPLHQPPPALPMHLPPPNMAQHPMVGGGARELISVTTSDEGHNAKGVILRSSLAQRLGPPSAGPRNNCSLELRKVPQGLCCITHLNAHFAKFGTIVNIQVKHDGDPEAATITFQKHSEANAAYRCTEAVLNNRFIKVFWHNPPAGGDGTTKGPVGVKPGEGRMFGHRNPNKFLNNHAINNKKTTFTAPPPSFTKTTEVVRVASAGVGSEGDQPESPPSIAAPDSSTPSQPKLPPPPPRLTAAEMKQQQIDAILQQQKQLAEEVAAQQKEDKRKTESIKLKMEVQERTKQLLAKQMKQLKLLLAKFDSDKDNSSKAEKKTLLETIKSLQKSIDVTKSQLKVTVPARPVAPFKPRPLPQPQLPPAPVAPKPAETAPQPTTTTGAVVGAVAKDTNELKKKILDTELDVYAATVAATETSETKEAAVVAEVAAIKTLSSSAQELAQLNTKLAQLKAHARQLSNSRGRGMSSYRGVSRGAARSVGRGGGAAAAPSAAAAPFTGHQPDRRTSKIHASGFEREDKDAVLTHFAGLGNVINFLWDGQTPSVNVEYSTRRHAEKAMSEGRMMGDRLLTLTWVNDGKSVSLPPVPSTQRYQELQYCPQDTANPAADDDYDDDDEVLMQEPTTTAAAVLPQQKFGNSAISKKRPASVLDSEPEVLHIKDEPSKPAGRDGTSSAAFIPAKKARTAPKEETHDVRDEDDLLIEQEVLLEEPSSEVKAELSLVLDESETVLDDDDDDDDDEEVEKDESSWKR